jgi:hypothetical protein
MPSARATPLIAEPPAPAQRGDVEVGEVLRFAAGWTAR